MSKPLRVRAFPWKSSSVKKLLCVKDCKRLLCAKASVSASFSVSRLLCIKTSLCKSFCVQNLSCAVVEGIYFPRFPLRRPCGRFHLAFSQRSSPQAISHGFPSVHTVDASIWLLPNGTLHKRLFPTQTKKKTGKERKQRRCRHRNTENPKAFPMHVPLPSKWHPFHKSYYRRALFRDNRIHGICPENPVPTLPPYAALPQLFPRLGHTIFLIEIVRKSPCHPPSPRPSGVSIIGSRDAPRRSISHRRPPCHHFLLAPSQHSSPMQAISHCFPSVHHACPMDPSLETLTKVLGAQFFCAIGLMPFVLKNPCQQVCSYSLAPRQGSYRPVFCTPLDKSYGYTIFRHIRRDVICPETPCAQLCILTLYRFLPTELSPSYFPRFPVRPTSSLPYRSFPPNSPQAIFPSISHGFPSVHPLVASVSLLPTEPPQAISHGFPSVHLLVASVSFLPNGTLPKLVRMVSLPSTHSSLLYRSFPSALSPSYFPRFPPVHPLVPPDRSFPPKLTQAISHCFPSVHPRHSRIAPSHRSSPHAISHGFPPVHPLAASVSLLPTTALPICYFPRFLPVHPLVTPVSPLRTELSPSYFPRFPFRPPRRHSRIAPSPRSSPQAIFPTISLPSTLSSLPYRSFPTGLPKLFPTVSYPSTLSSLPCRSFPSELTPSYFPRFPVRPPSRCFCIVPSQRGSPLHPLVASVSLLPFGALSMLFPTVSPPSTLSLLPYRSFPSELFPFRPPSRRFHGFLSVHPVITPVSLLSTGALPMLFPTFSLPSTLSSFTYRSFPSELFPFRPPSRRFHGFLSVHPVITPVSLLSTGALPMLFPTFSLPSTLSSFTYRSFPSELTPSYIFPTISLPST